MGTALGVATYQMVPGRGVRWIIEFFDEGDASRSSTIPYDSAEGWEDSLEGAKISVMEIQIARLHARVERLELSRTTELKAAIERIIAQAKEAEKEI